MSIKVSSMEKCIKKCRECINNSLSSKSLGESMIKCIKACIECETCCCCCVKLCSMKASIYKDMRKVCIKACKKCYAICSKHKNKHCQECAKACLECIKECQKLL